MIDVLRIRSFLTVAECLNFSVAARKLFITQPALSKQISSLEDDLGFRLFTRTNHSVALTPEGVLLYREFHDAIDKIDNAVLSISSSAKNCRTGSLKVGILRHLFNNSQLQQQFRLLMSSYPDIHIDLLFMGLKDLRDALYEHRIDAFITKEYDVNIIGCLNSQPLFSSPMVAVVSRMNSLSECSSLSIEDLKNESFLALSAYASAGYLNLLFTCCNTASFKPKITKYANDFETLFFYASLEPLVGIIDVSDIPPGEYDFSFIPLRDNIRSNTVLAWQTENNNPCLPRLIEAFSEQF